MDSSATANERRKERLCTGLRVSAMGPRAVAGGEWAKGKPPREAGTTKHMDCTPNHPYAPCAMLPLACLGSWPWLAAMLVIKGDMHGDNDACAAVQHVPCMRCTTMEGCSSSTSPRQLQAERQPASSGTVDR
jgi:hypothetical protein